MPEVRPIDANALGIYEIEVSKDIIKCNPDIKEIFAIFGAAIDRQPTLDYEPVVRCKDCVHWKKEKLYIGNNNAVSSKCEWFSSYSTIVGGIYTHRNDFCSYGAKMDEEVQSNANNNS